jgi:hypothetical protein
LKFTHRDRVKVYGRLAMGVQRKRRRREERLEEEEAREPSPENVLEKERPREREREATPADRVLDLQKTAGNRAVGATLSRWGLPWFPQTAAPQWPKEPQVIVDGVVIPLQSWSWSEDRGGTGAGSTGGERTQLNDVHVMTKMGDHSSDLMLKVAQGHRIKTVLIVIPGKDGKGYTLTLTDAVITGYSISEQLESWSLSFAKKEFNWSPPRAQPRP